MKKRYQQLVRPYHYLLSFLGNLIYGRPSSKLTVIGVTGTNGKSTTCLLIAKILEQAGYKVGVSSTAIFKVADKEWLNDKKMTMLGRFGLHRLMREMVQAGCQYAVIETSSEGIEQFRHQHIDYNVCVFTNLTPEHIESHGSFENYKQAKLKLFKKLAQSQNKTVIVANGDDEHCHDFINFKVDEVLTFGIKSEQVDFKADKLVFHSDGTTYSLRNLDYNLKLYGEFNVYNSLAATTVCSSLGVDLRTCKTALEQVSALPGRMEFVDQGQAFKVVVDYAPEPESVKQLYETIKRHQITQAKIIHVLGSCGGGRDVARRPVLGQLAAKYADYVVVTNEDPYDDNPQEIMDQVLKGAEKYGKILNENLWSILDRQLAINKAIDLAQAGDLVLITGKGCEQAICVAGGRKIPWDDRQAVKQALKMR